MTASLRLREGKMEGKGDKVGLDAEIVGVASSEGQELMRRINGRYSTGKSVTLKFE